MTFQPEPFRAAWWLPGAHAQTVAGRLLRPLDLLPLERERVDTPDGDFVDLDFAPEPAMAARNHPIALVLHGLFASDANYEIVSAEDLPLAFDALDDVPEGLAVRPYLRSVG